MSLFISQLRQRWISNNSKLCIGLDPLLEKLPKSVQNEKYPIFSFNKSIVDATHDLVCSYKPQMAYYSAQEAEDQLLMTIEYIKEKYSGIPVILDSKRGDIGATAEMYAREAFERFKADAVTVNPYMGGDTLEPFLNYKDRGVIILCKTSNPGSGDIQDLESGGKKIYELIAEKAAKQWNQNGNVALVVGATYIEPLAKIRQIVGDMPLLVPGVGAQGGDVKKVVANGRDSQGQGLIINSSRAIIYASNSEDFALAARKNAIELLQQMV